MYWWNIDALIDDLKRKKVSTIEKLKYFLGFWILGIVLYYLTLLVYEKISPKLLLTEGVLIASITFIGIIQCYKINTQGDNKEFIERVICLNWPITVQIFVFVTIVYVLLEFSIGYFALGDGLWQQIVDFLIVILTEAIFFGWLYASIKSVAHARRKSKQ